MQNDSTSSNSVGVKQEYENIAIKYSFVSTIMEKCGTFLGLCVRDCVARIWDYVFLFFVSTHSLPLPCPLFWEGMSFLSLF